MNRPDPPRLRHESGLPRELALALQASPGELPSDAELGTLRARLAATVGEPRRLKQSEPWRDALVQSEPASPSAAELRALRARLPAPSEGSGRPVTPRRPPLARRRVRLLAWALPAAALAAGLAHWATRDSTDESKLTPSARPSVSAPTAAPTTSAAPLVSQAQALPLPSPSPSPSSTGSHLSQPPPAARPTETDELGLLREAQKALASDPARALQLAHRHAVAFPRGLLAQERAVVTIDALTRLGRQAEARARAEQFRAAYPTSAYLARIQRLVSEPSAAPSPSAH